MLEVRLDRNIGTGRKLRNALLPLEGEGIVNWTGRPLDDATGPVLNAHSKTDKLSQLLLLRDSGVRVPPFFILGEATPPDWGPSWLPRTRLHQQGRDFTSPIIPDFWVKKLPLEDEWRLHFFRTKKGNLRLLRSGIKLPKTLKAHPWVKAHRLGWKIAYTGGAPFLLVEQAREAMQALDLDFGAVDIALTPRLEAVILEVNTCPGLDTGTLGLYVSAIKDRLT